MIERSEGHRTETLPRPGIDAQPLRSAIVLRHLRQSKRKAHPPQAADGAAASPADLVPSGFAMGGSIPKLTPRRWQTGMPGEGGRGAVRYPSSPT